MLPQPLKLLVVSLKAREWRPTFGQIMLSQFWFYSTAWCNSPYLIYSSMYKILRYINFYRKARKIISFETMEYCRPVLLRIPFMLPWNLARARRFNA